MDFEGQYLTYLEYKGLGGTLDQTSFNLLEFACRKQVDARTQNRLHYVSVIPQEVKLCIYDLIDCVEKYNETVENAKGNVESENIDGYSVKYITSTRINEIIKSKDVEIEDIISTQLFGVIVNDEHLIYLGVK